METSTDIKVEQEPKRRTDGFLFEMGVYAIGSVVFFGMMVFVLLSMGINHGRVTSSEMETATETLVVTANVSSRLSFSQCSTRSLERHSKEERNCEFQRN